MKKFILILIFLSTVITKTSASSLNYKETTKLKVKSCFDLLSKKRNEMLPGDIERAENYLKNKIEKDEETKNIVIEVYTEEINRLFNNNPLPEGIINIELENIRISGIKLGLDEKVPHFSFSSCNLL